MLVGKDGALKAGLRGVRGQKQQHGSEVAPQDLDQRVRVTDFENTSGEALGRSDRV